MQPLDLIALGIITVAVAIAIGLMWARHSRAQEKPAEQNKAPVQRQSHGGRVVHSRHDPSSHRRKSDRRRK